MAAAFGVLWLECQRVGPAAAELAGGLCLRPGKFFASVARVDNVWGDRNLVCSCPPMEDWLETG